MLADIGLTGVKQFRHANLRQPECFVHKYNVYKFFSIFIAVKENFTVLHHFMFHLLFPPVL